MDRLRSQNEITEAEYQRLVRFAAADTGSLAFNILIGFGAVATAVGALALAAVTQLGLLCVEPTAMVTYKRALAYQAAATFLEIPRREPRAVEVEIAVQAVGLNFKDVMITMGLLWLFIDNVYLKPFERVTIERWGQVTTAEQRE